MQLICGCGAQLITESEKRIKKYSHEKSLFGDKLMSHVLDRHPSSQALCERFLMENPEVFDYGIVFHCSKQKVIEIFKVIKNDPRFFNDMGYSLVAQTLWPPQNSGLLEILNSHPYLLDVLMEIAEKTAIFQNHYSLFQVIFLQSLSIKIFLVNPHLIK